MNLILSQDQQIFQVTKVWSKKHYIRPYSTTLIGRLNPFKMYVCQNVYGKDINGSKVLLGSYNDELESNIELKRIRSTKDYIYSMTIY